MDVSVVGVRRLELAPGDCHTPGWNLTGDPQPARPCFVSAGTLVPGLVPAVVRAAALP